MKKLTSITRHSDYLDTLNIPRDNKWDLHCLRKDFGKRPLELGMFVPCDEYGKIMKEPTFDAYMQPKEMDRHYESYWQAKKRVLFEGLDLEAAKHHISQNRTIEYLANFGKLALTENALKHLGL